MLTAQRFQLSVLAGGEAERWPPISLNTWSPTIPCLSFSLSLPLSLASIPPSLYHFLFLSLSLTSHPSPGEGADSAQRPSLSKRACYSAPSLWDSKKTHTHSHESAHSQNMLSQKPCTQHTPTHSYSLTRIHKYFVPMPTKYYAHIHKLLTALRGCSACCQHFSKYADILHVLIRIKCIIHTDTNLQSFCLFHHSSDTNLPLYGVLLSIHVIGWNLPIISYNLIMSGESEELTGVQSGVWNYSSEILNASLQMNLQVPPQLYSRVHHNTMCILRDCSLLSLLSCPDNLWAFSDLNSRDMKWIDEYDHEQKIWIHQQYNKIKLNWLLLMHSV